MTNLFRMKHGEDHAPGYHDRRPIRIAFPTFGMTWQRSDPRPPAKATVSREEIAALLSRELKPKRS